MIANKGLYEMALNPPTKPVLAGVPQGSLLFVLFINNLHQGISIDKSIAFYAEDTKIWRSIKKTRKILHNCRGI